MVPIKELIVPPPLSLSFFLGFFFVIPLLGRLKHKRSCDPVAAATTLTHSTTAGEKWKLFAALLQLSFYSKNAVRFIFLPINFGLIVCCSDTLLCALVWTFRLEWILDLEHHWSKKHWNKSRFHSVRIQSPLIFCLWIVNMARKTIVLFSFTKVERIFKWWNLNRPHSFRFTFFSGSYIISPTIKTLTAKRDEELHNLYFLGWVEYWYCQTFHGNLLPFSFLTPRDLSWPTLEIRPKATLTQAHLPPLVLCAGTFLT